MDGDPKPRAAVESTSRDRFRGALLGTFVGDALGMPLEGGRRAGVYVREMLPARLGRGTYTDDTQLMIALAEALLDTPGRLDLDRVARRFGEAFDFHRGYGGHAARILAMIQGGAGWRDAVKTHPLPGGSFGNGAAMRVAPVALAFHGDAEAVAEAAERQGEVTGHSHPLGTFGARTVALAVHRALQRGDAGRPFDASGFLEEVVSQAPGEYEIAFEWIAENLAADPGTAARVLGTTVAASRSVPYALWCFLSSQDDPEEAVARAVNSGGDTDTLGAMTGAIAGAFRGESGWPERWLSALENGEKGRDYVVGLADGFLVSQK